MDKTTKQLFQYIQARFQPKLIIVSGVPPMQHFQRYQIHWLGCLENMRNK